MLIALFSKARDFRVTKHVSFLYNAVAYALRLIISVHVIVEWTMGNGHL